jgi:hypothetical protein
VLKRLPYFSRQAGGARYGAGGEVRSGMRELGSIFVGLAALALAGCTSSGLPVLPSPQAAPEPSSLPVAEEKSFIVPGSPTEIYAQLARGMHGCWFGASGPLRQSHIFHAEAEPSAKGGEAEIVLQERDVTLRDQRGVRAYRVRIVGEPPSVRVTTIAHKMPSQLVPVMAKDVDVWAKGGSGCQLAALFPPPPPSKAEKPVKKKGKPKKK